MNTMSFPDELMFEPVNNEDNDRIDILYARLNDLQVQRTVDIANADKAAQRANAAAVRANKAEVDRKEIAAQAYLDYQEQFIEQD